MERLLYTLHRVTGLGLLAFLGAHLFVSAARIRGEADWKAAMEATSGGVFLLAEYLVWAAFAFHALNGVRLILTELGFGLGKPTRPIFPYTTSLDRQRRLSVAVIALTALFVLLGGIGVLGR